MISKKEKFFYGMGDLSANILFSAVSFYLLYYLVKIAGLTTFLVPIIFMIGKVWDAITDYLMGRISDKTKNKFGKRRIYMLLGAIPYGLTFMLLWLCPFEMTKAVKCIYFTFIYMLYNTAFTVVYIPYNSLSANMTNDYDERTSLNAIRIIMANIGILLGAAVFSLLAEGEESILYSIDGTEKTAYAVAGVIFGVVAFTSMIIATLNVHERVEAEIFNQYSFFSTLKQFFKLREFRCNLLYYLLSMVGFDIVMAIFMFYVSDSLGLGGGIISMIFIAIPLIMAMISSIIWVKLTEKYEKHKVYFAASIYMAIVLLSVLLVPKATDSATLTYVGLSITVVLVGIGMSAIQIIPYATLPDVVEIDEYKNNVRREGAFFGIVQFIYKLANGFAISMVSVILGLFGYVENADLKEGYENFTQPNQALWAIRIVLGLIPGILFLISSIFAFRGKITRKHFNEVKEELDKRKNINKVEEVK